MGNKFGTFGCMTRSQVVPHGSEALLALSLCLGIQGFKLLANLATSLAAHLLNKMMRVRAMHNIHDSRKPRRILHTSKRVIEMACCRLDALQGPKVPKRIKRKSQDIYFNLELGLPRR